MLTATRSVWNGWSRAGIGVPIFLLLLFFSACQPPRERLAEEAELAAQKGWEAVLHRMAEPSTAAYENGGWTTLMDSDSGQCQRYGPGMFVEAQAYDMNWFMAGHMGPFRNPENEPLARRIVAVLKEWQHPYTGSWPWSDDGCVHERFALSLWRYGEREAARKAADWAAQWALHERLTEDGLLRETEGVYVIKSWGALQGPPKTYDGGFPPVDPFFLNVGADDELPMLLRLFHESGTKDRYPEVWRRLVRGYHKILDHPGLDRRKSSNFIRIFALAEYPALVDEGILPKDAYYGKAVAILRELAFAQEKKLTVDSAALGCLLLGVARTPLLNEIPETVDLLVLHLLNAQDIGGEWVVNKFLFMDPRMHFTKEDFRVGGVVGDIEAVTTYHATWALKAYVDAVRKGAEK